MRDINRAERLLSLVVLGYVLLSAVALLGAVLPSNVVPFSYVSTSPVERTLAMLLLSATYALVLWSGALLAGAALVAAAPRHGMAACVVLTGIIEAVLLTFGLYVLSRTSGSSIWLAVWIVGLATPISLLLGGAIIRRRWNGRILRTAEQTEAAKVP